MKAIVGHGRQFEAKYPNAWWGNIPIYLYVWYARDMEEIDGRELSPEDQHKRRKRVVRLLKAGMSIQEISDIVGVCRTHVSVIWKAYLIGGSEALKPKMRGRKVGDHRKLTTNQETRIIDLIANNTPAQLKLGSTLWTRDAIRSLIMRESGTEMPLRTISDYLKRWGLTPQNPIRRASGKKQQKVQRWLESEYPDVVARAKEERAEIHWCDDTGVGGIGYVDGLPISMISSITNQGKVRFLRYPGDVTAHVFLRFISLLVRECRRKVFLILYHHEGHYGQSVDTFLKLQKDKIELFHLP